MCEESYHASACAESGIESESEVRREAAPSLESQSNPCGPVPIAEVRAKRCRSWYCQTCCKGKGLAVRRKLIKALGQFQAVQMWTLTVDPTLFDGDPQAAYEYLSAKRCVAELVRTLRDQGLLLSDRYFYVIEFHKNGFPHIHIIFDAKFISHQAIQDRWNLFRPSWAGPVEGKRPAFGMVRFSRREDGKRAEFESVEHAACYVTAYLVKHPEYGYPEWVLNSKRRIVRYRSSRGLFNALTGSEEAPSPEVIEEEPIAAVPVPGPEGDGVETCCGDETCWCPACRGEGLSTVGERVERCGKETNLFDRYPAGEDGVERREFRRRLVVPFDEVSQRLGRAPIGGGVDLAPAEAAELERQFGYVPSSIQRGDVSRSGLCCPFGDDERHGSVRAFLTHLRESHGLAGERAFDLLEEAIDAIPAGKARSAWADALERLLVHCGGEVDSIGDVAGSCERGETA